MKNNNYIKEYIKGFSKEFKQAKELIKKSKKIAIFRHRIPDFDALGSQLGLKYFLQEAFPEKEIIALGDDHNKFTPRLYEPMDVVGDDWFDDDTLAIIIDVSEYGRVADERAKTVKNTIVFDHHPSKELPIGTIAVDTNLAAAAEMGLMFCLYTGYKLTKKVAEMFYSGIVGDSGRFLYSGVTSLTFQLAEVLLETGLKITDVYSKMYQNDISDLKVLGFILSNFVLTEGKVAYYILKDADLQKLQLDQISSKNFVNTFANYEGIDVWCSISEDTTPEDPCWRISIRSKKVDISKVANKYQGGGHAQASGARIDDLKKELPEFIKDLETAIKEG